MLWEAVRHIRQVNDEIRWVSSLPEEELMSAAKEMQAPYELVVETAKLETSSKLCSWRYCYASRCCINDAIRL